MDYPGEPLSVIMSIPARERLVQGREGESGRFRAAGFADGA